MPFFHCPSVPHTAATVVLAALNAQLLSYHSQISTSEHRKVLSWLNIKVEGCPYIRVKFQAEMLWPTATILKFISLFKLAF